MINLDNHNNHSHCTHYIYLTLGVNERQGLLYIGQHKCKKKGKFDADYFGSGTIIGNIRKKYGIDYIRDNFRTIPLWWCEDQDEANEMEQFFIAEYETKEIGMNIADGGEGGGWAIEQRQKYWNDKFGNSEFIAYTKEEMDGFAIKEQKDCNKVHYEQHKEELKAYYEQNKEELKAKRKAYREQHNDEIRAKARAYNEQHKEERKAYREQHKEELKAKRKAYYEQHKEEQKARVESYRKQHKNEINAQRRAKREQNKEEINAYQKAYYEQNKAEINARRRAKRAEQEKNKPQSGTQLSFDFGD